MSTSTTRKATTRALAILLALPLSVAITSGAASAAPKPAETVNPFAASPGVALPTGNGGGNAKVQIAGARGKADDKNPGGQYVGDGNKGYECDANRGIGPMNPAHTGCTAYSAQFEHIE